MPRYFAKRQANAIARSLRGNRPRVHGKQGVSSAAPVSSQVEATKNDGGAAATFVLKEEALPDHQPAI